MKILYLHPRAWTGEASLFGTFLQMGHSVCVLEEIRPGEGISPGIRPHFLDAGDGCSCLWFDPHRGIEKLLTWPVDRYHKRSFGGRNIAHIEGMIRRAVQAFAPDVVVASDGFSYGIPAGRLRARGRIAVPLVTSYIGGDILDNPEAQVGRQRTPAISRLIRQGIAGGDVLRAVSPLVEKTLVLEGAEPGKILMCPSHLPFRQQKVDAAWSEKHRLRRDIRARHGLPQSCPLVITLSGNQKGKGLHLLAESWPLILREVPGVRWLLCGPRSGWVNEKVLPLLGKAGVADSVVLAGSLGGAAVLEHLAAADLHVNPSLCESLNMVTVEAGAVGTPTVGSDGAGVSDWLLRHGAGLVVPAGSAIALTGPVVSLLRDPGRLAVMGAQGRAMMQEFLPDRVAGTLIAAFGSAIGSAPGAVREGRSSPHPGANDQA